MAIILSLILIIMLHEFGHLIVAKLCKCKVNKFSIGFGKALISKEFNGTTYQIAPILLGGYCELDNELSYSRSKRAFTNKSYTQKVLISIAGIFINVVTGIIACYIGSHSGNIFIFKFGYYSIWIGLSNLLPVPALDGSYPLIFLFEKRWGKKKTYLFWSKVNALFFKWLMILNILTLPLLAWLIYAGKI